MNWSTSAFQFTFGVQDNNRLPNPASFGSHIALSNTFDIVFGKLILFVSSAIWSWWCLISIYCGNGDCKTVKIVEKDEVSRFSFRVYLVAALRTSIDLEQSTSTLCGCKLRVYSFVSSVLNIQCTYRLWSDNFSTRHRCTAKKKGRACLANTACNHFIERTLDVSLFVTKKQAF